MAVDQGIVCPVHRAWGTMVGSAATKRRTGHLATAVLGTCDYIHYNPVKHGLVARVADWPYSSFHRFVENGGYPLDWAGHPELTDAVGFGE